MIPPDADHPSSTPVVHLTRRAALAAERAGQAGRTKGPGRAAATTTPVDRGAEPVRSVDDRAGASRVAAHRVPERHPDTRIRRVPRRQVALAPHGRAVAAPRTACLLYTSD
ncbi:hypothetical protein, partial [Curtobacterium sp. MCBD17_021]|uniref:hypothetical protein n=1 Tax=Curtobacterium sp. MCBD17_021 TaxID=2175665 RepID=UPI001C6505BD